MTQIAKHLLKWRLADIEGTGTDQVNIVMPEMDGLQPREILLPTDIPSPHPTAMDLRWTEDDLSLFFLLLNKMLELDVDGAEPLDLTDEGVIDVLHVVAAARFITPLPADDLLADDIPTVMREVDVGDIVAMHCHDGFKSAVVVALDSIDATCVLLDPISGHEEFFDFDVYDTLVVNKHSLLPGEFGNVVAGSESIVH